MRSTFIPPGGPHSAGNASDVEADPIEMCSPPRSGDVHVVDAPTEVGDAPNAAG